MLYRVRPKPPAGFIEPSLPSPADKPPAGLKLDSRNQARRLPAHGPARSRGHSAADPAEATTGPTASRSLVEAVNHLRLRSCLIDGEVVCCDERGVARFDVLRRRRNEPQAFLYAFDLLELDGADMRREPIEVRKATLASILRKSRPRCTPQRAPGARLRLTVFQHACKMGLEGIVSKRLGSRYRSGRSPDWLKFKNPAAPAVRREAEEDWGR